MKHCLSCEKSQEAYRKRIAEFEAKYPNYCRKCGGLGAIYYQDDPSPAGVGLSAGTMTFDDPCSECVENGICPLCGSKNMRHPGNSNLDYDECQDCGWNDNPDSKERRPQAPEAPECDCYEVYASDLEYFEGNSGIPL